jgi:hypothetical protein
MSASDLTRRFDRLPIISGLPPINGHHLTGPAGPFRASNRSRGRVLLD